MPLTRRSCLVTLAALPVHSQTGGTPAAFQWPEGKRAAISLTFDDARLSQVDTGLDVLKRAGAKATFYLGPGTAKKRLDGWKRAVSEGHEIGNHSQSHPCTANYRFSIKNALEDYTEARMSAELVGANADLQQMLGVKPVSFAYPCGQTFIGRGTATRSYIPLVAKHFLTGRGYLNESANDPAVCDLPHLMGTAFDDLEFGEMRKLVDAAAKEGRWLVFVGHEMGKRAFQSTDIVALEELCRYVRDPANGLWLDTVANVARHVRASRK
jgi:peptidoglycan/xylan/chitin deacetylase (PgdA/CDA1 family)